MFDLHFKDGDFVLVWSDRQRGDNERGMWALIGHKDDLGVAKCVSENRKMGLEVVIDEHGCYRALILKD